MPGSIALMLSQTGGPPFHSVGYVNEAIAPILARNGWQVRSFSPPRNAVGEEGMLPFALAASLAALDGAHDPDVALYDAAGLGVRAPGRGWARRNVVLYHGLAYGTGNWMASPDIDLHCANSPYLERVLHALFAFPNWRRRQCLNPVGMRSLAHLRLPVPGVEFPDGHPGFSHGVGLPAQVERLLASDTVWGHALQPGKQDWFATLSVMYWLNELGAGRRFGLMVSAHSLNDDTRRALDSMLAPLRRSCDDYFAPVPHLDQRALFGLQRACRFGLAYNHFPEPFGFYVLESVLNGCPVYTNGVGNNRFLLPPGHGIVVMETAAMAGDRAGGRDPGAWRCVAERILADLAAGQVGQDCGRGAQRIRDTWSPAHFEQSLVGALARLDSAPSVAGEFDTLRIGPSPLLRSLDPATGVLLDDYACGVLDPATTALATQLQGQRCADLDADEMERIEAEHGLFARGILALLPEQGGAGAPVMPGVGGMDQRPAAGPAP